MTKRSDITPEYIAQCIVYIPDSGVLIWKERPIHHFASEHSMKVWNKKYANKVISYRTTRGYSVVCINGIRIYGIQIAYVLMTGQWATDKIDHIDLNPRNDCWINLRQATESQNSFNQKIRTNNTSGFKGVTFVKSKDKFKATITANKKHHHLGYFDTAEEAGAAYAEASLRIHGEFGRVK